MLEQAAKLEETGAGLQLSPNATRVLIGLGLRERLEPVVMAPQAIRVMAGGSGRAILRIPLGAEAERRYGAPYWTLHRGDLQAALAGAALTAQDVVLKLGVRVEDFAAHVNGVSVQGRRAAGRGRARRALIGADGIWSGIGGHLGRERGPRFAHRTAWRALVPAESAAPEFREPLVHLWLGLDAHLVHYPVKGGRLINIVAVVHDEWNQTGWSAAGEALRSCATSRVVLGSARADRAPDRWLKWALLRRKTPFLRGVGPVTLIGDAAHPMLPFLAQGAGMAIEDAAVLADMLGKYIDDPADALRGYEGARWHRTRRAQQAARRQARIYGKTGPEALIRNLAMRMLGGERLRARQDWLYTWRAPELVMHDPEKWTPVFGPDDA